MGPDRVEVIARTAEETLYPNGRRAPRGRPVLAEWAQALADISSGSGEDADSSGDNNDGGDDVKSDVHDDDIDEDLFAAFDARSVDGSGSSVIDGTQPPTPRPHDIDPWVEDSPQPPVEVEPKPDEPPPHPPVTPSDHGDDEAMSKTSSSSSSSSSRGPSNSSDSSSNSDKPEDDDPLEVDHEDSVMEPGPAFGARVGATTAFRVGCGYIAYYEHKQQVSAYCRFPGHGTDCKRGRIMTERKPKWQMKPAQGRPLGFCAAWLRNPNDATNDWDHIHGRDPEFDMRDEARHSLHEECDDAEALAMMLRAERPQRPGEGVEPMDCP